MVEYDHDSFIAGFAVGRTLWRPHIVAPGSRPIAVPCYGMNEPVELLWTVYTRQFTNIMFHVEGGEFPAPGYWMLWYDPDDVDYKYWFVYFSPNTSWDASIYAAWETWGWDEETAQYMFVARTASQMTIYESSEIARCRVAPAMTSPYIPSQFFGELGYITCSSIELSAFLDNARMVQGPEEQLYVVGEIP